MCRDKEARAAGWHGAGGEQQQGTLEQSPAPVKLSDRHRDELRASGLTDQTIERSGIFSAKDIQIAALLGWQPRDHPWGGGFVIPFLPRDGSEPTYFRVKLDHPRYNGNGKVIKYESPPRKPSRAYFPSGFDEMLQNSGKPIVLTEGEKKALRILLAGWPCIGLVGVWGWQQRRDKTDTGRAYGPRHLLLDLDGIAWKERVVIIVFDSDAVTKPGVQLAEARLADVLSAKGAEVRVARLPADGPEKVGADDYIVKHGPEAFQKVLAEAKPAEVPPLPQPMDWARMYVSEEHTVKTGVTLRWHQDQFYGWDRHAYKPVPDSDMRGILLQWLDEHGAKAIPRLASDVLKCLASEVRIPADVDPPALLGHHGASSPDWVVFQNGILDLGDAATDTAITPKACTPQYFTTVALPYEYKPDATCPVWFETLDGIFLGDIECVDVLSEWFGYCLTTDTRLHAILLIEGPPRSGKGTILRAMRHVIGDQNCVSPRLSALGELFGLWGLLGKRLAICPDAHLGHGGKALATTETLKLISGEDAVEVHRKHLPSITARLHVRFAMACNELPEFGDYAGALAARVVVLPCRQSFLGQEDRSLEEKLRSEVSGIANWALDGLVRLRKQGEFTRPAVSVEVEEEFHRLVSPLKSFLNDRCTVSPDVECTRDELWEAWRSWCESTGHRPGSRDTLGTRLRPAIPHLQSGQRRLEDGSRPRTYKGVGLR